MCEIYSLYTEKALKEILRSGKEYLEFAREEYQSPLQLGLLADLFQQSTQSQDALPILQQTKTFRNINSHATKEKAGHCSEESYDKTKT